MRTVLTEIALLVSPAIAQTHTVYPIQTAQTEPDGCWGCCCGTDTVTANPSLIQVKSCTYQGGYCMGDSNRAAWLFAIPEGINPGDIASAKITGNRSGGSYGSGWIACRWTTGTSLSISNVLDTINNSDYSATINWPASYTYNLNIASSFINAVETEYLLVVAGTSSEYGIDLVNTGAGQAHLEITIQSPTGACCTSTSGCTEVSQYLCEQAGFVFLGEDTDCQSASCKQCLGDFNGNGAVDVDDLLALISVYGTEDSDHDLDGDELIRVEDLLLLLANYGECQ